MTNTSVVIVNYNSGRFLEACVESVVSSDCALEVIVVDNASTDDSAKFLDNLTASDTSLCLIRNIENRGFSAGINRGVECSKSENILLLNPDCLVFPHTIRSLCEVLNEDPCAGIVGGLVFNFDGSEQRGCRRREPTLARSFWKVFRRYVVAAESNQVDMIDEPLPKQQVYVDAVSGSFMMIRRATFTAVGGMDEGFFLHFEDLDLCRRVRDIGWKVVFSPNISIFHYQGGSSERSDDFVVWQKHRSMRRYQTKHHAHNRWLQSSVFLLVWTHYLLQRTTRMFGYGLNLREERKWSSAAMPLLPLMPIPVGGGVGNRLLVLGMIEESIQNMIHFGTATGWSIYACNEVAGYLRPGDVYWLNKEYLEKVPMRDALEFNALLIAPSLSGYEETEQIVEKFRVGRTAVIEFVTFLDRTNDDVLENSPEAGAPQEFLTNDRLKGKGLDCETRLFFLPVSKQARESHAIRIQRDEIIQNCFSWLSE